MCVCAYTRKATKESLVHTSSDITESLMSISRMMAEQVHHSEDTVGSLGKALLLLFQPLAARRKPRTDAAV